MNKPDSLKVINFLSSNDSLKSYGLDSLTAMTAVIPNTYLVNWNTSFRKIFNKLKDEQEKFWNPARRKKAADKNLTPAEVYSMASIVEEETNKLKDKGLIASVYMNRIKKGMRLEADPTVKFGLRDFEIKRVYSKHTDIPTPYNTYSIFGLPPGPICTPSLETLDAVLNSPTTEYYFFVAKSDFSGAHVFTTNYDDHMKYAREYHVAYDKRFGTK